MRSMYFILDLQTYHTRISSAAFLPRHLNTVCLISHPLLSAICFVLCNSRPPSLPSSVGLSFSCIITLVQSIYSTELVSQLCVCAYVCVACSSISEVLHFPLKILECVCVCVCVSVRDAPMSAFFFYQNRHQLCFFFYVPSLYFIHSLRYHPTLICHCNYFFIYVSFFPSSST